MTRFPVFAFIDRAAIERFLTSEDGAFLSFRPATVHAGTITVESRGSDLGVAPDVRTYRVTGYSGFDTPGPVNPPGTPGPAGRLDERWNDFVFLWDFGDPGKTFPQVPRLPEQHDNANVAYGPLVAHSFGPGTYNVSCLVIELSSGKTALWEETRVVADPEVFFAGKTITVGPSGADFTTLAGALLAARAVNDVRRVQIQRDITLNVNGSFGFISNNTAEAWRNVYISAAPGAGAKPIINWTGTGGGEQNIFRWLGIMDRYPGQPNQDFVMQNVVLQAGWDPATESGLTESALFGLLADGRDLDGNVAEVRFPDRVMLEGVEFYGLTISVYLVSSSDNRIKYFAASNCVIGAWQDYGIFGNADWVTTIGCRMEQDSDALVGGPRNGPLRNNHNPYRTYEVNYTCVDGCSFFTMQGWTDGGAFAGYRAAQPCFRWAQDEAPWHNANNVSYLNMQRSVLEGGLSMFSAVDPNTRGQSINNVNARIEKCYFLGTAQTANFFDTQYGGYTIRNNVFVMPNPSRRLTFGLGSIFLYSDSGHTSGAQVDRILIEHNTIVNLENEAAMPIFTDNDGLGGINAIVRNNVIHQPNATVPQTTFAPLGTAVVFTPLFTQIRRRTEIFNGTIPPGGVSNGSNFTIPYSQGEYGNGTQTSYLAQAQAFHSFSLGAFTVSFGASNITVTNTSGGTWAGNAAYQLILERTAAALPPAETDVATPAGTGSLYAPQAGSAALAPTPNPTPAVRDDWFGAVRGPSRDLGAIQVTT